MNSPRGQLGRLSRVLVGLFILLASRGAEAALRAALVDFTSDDNSYRSATVAADCAATLQARLSNVTEVEWVERRELELAASELSLTGFGLVSSGTALRMGKWVKADIALLGRFDQGQPAGRSLRLEVIDLDRADVLAERTVTIAAGPSPPLALTPREMEQVVEELRDALAESVRRLKERKTQMVVAPLFFLNGGTEERLNFLEGDLSTSAFQGEEIGAWMPREPAPCPINRLAAWEHWLLVDAGQPLLFDTEQRRWTNLQPCLFADSLRRQWGAYNDWPQNNAVAAATADASGFWIGTEAGLAFFKPTTGEWKTMSSPWAPDDPTGYWVNPVRQFCRQRRERDTTSIAPAWPQTKLAGAVTALTIDGDYLWIATHTGQDGFRNSPAELEGGFIYLLHRPTRQWVGQFRVPHPVTALAVAGDSLYAAATDGGAARLIAIDKARLLAVPCERWVADTIPETELAAQITRLPRDEQARYAFFHDDDRQVVRILGDPAPQSADLASLFLLGHAYDSLGLNEPAKSRSYFEEIRARKPDRYSVAAAERALKALP